MKIPREVFRWARRNQCNEACMPSQLESRRHRDKQTRLRVSDGVYRTEPSGDIACRRRRGALPPPEVADGFFIIAQSGVEDLKDFTERLLKMNDTRSKNDSLE